MSNKLFDVLAFILFSVFSIPCTILLFVWALMLLPFVMCMDDEAWEKTKELLESD